jgi:hypothetical protein
MTKTLMLALALVLLTGGLSGQDQTPGQKHPGPPAKTSVQGCLIGADGSYALISDSGTTYQLSGRIPDVSKYFGHEVQITGSTAGGGSPSSESSPTSLQILKVAEVKYISESCSKGTL